MGRKRQAGTWIQPEGWGGGRAWQAPDGTITYYIRRKIDGRLYDKSTRATTRAAAEAQLRRFEADPAAYQAGGDARRPPVFLTNDQAKAFLRWSQVVRENSDQWVKKQQAILAWWMEHLKGVDLRRATLQDHILPPLAGPKVHGKSQRIEIIKTFYGWLRKVEHTISAHEDPTYGALPAGQGRPAQHRKSKVIPREHYLLAREHLVGVFRDALDVLAGTGWHVTELVRFADDGVIEPLPKSMRVSNGAMGVLVCPMHKSGDTHRTAVSQEVLGAAARLRAHRWPFESVLPFYQAVEAACRAVKLPVPRPDGTDGIDVFTPGRFRHSVATWAFEKGADPAAVSAFLGHKSPQTTKRFYATLATVPKIPTLA
jgi:integrase